MRIKELISPREYEVARLVAHGKRNGEIALILHISQDTVKHHLTNIFDKIGVDSRLQLGIRFAVEEQQNSTVGQLSRSDGDCITAM